MVRRFFNGRLVNKEKLDYKTLNEMLKSYDGIFSNEIYSYLESLIGLETSVLNDSNITPEKMTRLLQLDLYKKIISYNLYERAYKKLSSLEDLDLKFSGDKETKDSLAVYAHNKDDKDFTVLRYQEYPKKNLYSLEVFGLKEDEERRKIEIDNVLSRLEVLYDQRNPYQSRPGVVGGPGTTWAFDHYDKIKSAEDYFTDLDSRNHLTEEQEYEAYVKEYISEIILKDNGINPETDLKVSENSTNMEIQLVKTYPSIIVSKNIRHY